MRILESLRIGLGVLFTGCTMAIYAADITVPPGTGTLAAAVASASNGDTLILQNGSYDGDVSVDKTLLLRAQSQTTDAVIGGVFDITGAGIEVTVQGLTFSQTSQIWQGAAVRLLQNHWISGSINVTNYQTAEGDGSLVVIGNKINSGSLSTVSTDNAYIAGNVFLDGGIGTASSVWIVGNEILGNLNLSGGSSIVRILGNRIDCRYHRTNFCITINAGDTFFSNNIFKDSDSTLSDWSILSSGANITIVNNTIDAGPGGSTDGDWYGVRLNGSSGVIEGNIISGFYNPISGSGVVDKNNNLCFNNTQDCPAENGNLNDIDPQFVDLVDYRLSPTSPAIDAGPSDFELADLDRSRNDIGAYGGPWSIGQYDLQRDPSNYAPYVYPLFQGGAAFSGGTLDLQALGVAKLR